MRKSCRTAGDRTALSTTTDRSFTDLVADAYSAAVVLASLVEHGLFPGGQRIINVDGACASGSAAFNGAWSAIQAGADLTLAIGVEKMNPSDGDGLDIGLTIAILERVA